MSRITKRALVLTGLLAWPAAPVLAQEHAGIRAGVSGAPDQFFFGGHVETSPVARRLTFRPNVELGIGDDLVVAAINLEFVHSIPLERQPWRIYFGAGPAAVIASRRRREDSVGGGFNLLVGAERRTGLFTEFKVGLVDSPEVKATVGFAFR